jgi:branched-chain amino acid aminotransferase
LARAVYEKGVRVETRVLRREHPRLKSTSFIARSDSERKQIARNGIFEALLVRDGEILEGMTSNFFYIPRAERLTKPKRGAMLYTARDDILLGVTRETVIEIARGRGLELREQSLHLDQLVTVEEAFITSSSRGIVPVIRVDDVTIGQGSPGPVTRELMTAYESYVLEKAERIQA